MLSGYEKLELFLPYNKDVKIYRKAAPKTFNWLQILVTYYMLKNVHTD
jgi:hypothetical protein